MLGALVFALVLITIDLVQGNHFDYAIFWMLPLFVAGRPVTAPIALLVLPEDRLPWRREL